MTEAILLRQSKHLLKMLAASGLLAWRRLHVMPVISHAGGKTLFRKNTDMQGMPDLVILLKDHVTLWAELKAPRGRQSETQKQCQTEWESLGHHYRVIRSSDELANWLGDYAQHPLLEKRASEPGGRR